MSQYYLVNESTEDTLDSADDLQSAIRLAREAALQGQAGDRVTILESGGKAVRQFVLLPDGAVIEQAIARRVNRSVGEEALNGAEQVAPANRPRE
jgi:hypothetical protein